MKSTIIVCFLLATTLCAPEIYRKHEKNSNQKRFMFTVKSSGYVTLQPLIELMNSQVNNVVAFKKAPLLLDSSRLEKFHNQVSNGDMNSLWKINIEDTDALLKKMDSAALNMKYNISKFSSTSDVFKSQIHTVKDISDRINEAQSQITEDQCKKSMKVILDQLHTSTLKNVEGEFHDTQMHTMYYESDIKESRKIMDKLETQIKAAKSEGKDIPNLDTILNEFASYRTYFDELDTQANTYINANRENESNWDKYNIQYQTMYKEVFEITDMKSHWGEYYAQFNEIFSLIGNTLNALA